LDQPAKLWEDSVHMGFWGWERYNDVLLMSAELELAVWNIRGEKLWSTFVEPPWDYRLVENTISIEVMGAKASFPYLLRNQGVGVGIQVLPFSLLCRRASEFVCR
jgi:hypothetical protein